MSATADATLDLAGRHLARGLTGNAIALLKRVLSEDPENALAHALLSHSLVGERRIHAALHEGRIAVELDPENAFSHRALAGAYVGLRKFDEAREHCQRSIELSPEDPDAHLELSRVELVQGRTREAELAAIRARDLDPDDPNVLAILGRCQLSRGSVDEAERSAREALECSAENASALILMGHILLYRGEIEPAREHAVSVLYSAPESKEALELLVAIKIRTSFLLGLWWRYSVWTAIWPTRAIAILVAAFLLQSAARIWARAGGAPISAETISLAWFALCAYTWISPAIYQRALKKELAEVRLRDDF